MLKGTASLTLSKRPRMLGLALALSCVLFPAGLQAAPDAGSVSTGTWAGDHIVLEVSEKGAEVELDCAHGQVTQPMTIGKHGDFDVAGTFTPEHGGPVSRDENRQPAAARYFGRVEGDTLALTVTIDKEKVGDFTLSRGAQSHLTKCR
jgi:hypothetical protein